MTEKILEMINIAAQIHYSCEVIRRDLEGFMERRVFEGQTDIKNLIRKTLSNLWMMEELIDELRNDLSKKKR